MKAEIGYDADRGMYLCVTPGSPTEHTMLMHVAKELGFEMNAWQDAAMLYRRATPVVVKREECGIAVLTEPPP